MKKDPELPQGPCIRKILDYLAAGAADGAGAAGAAGAASLAACFFSACFLCTGFEAAGAAAGAEAAAGAAVVSAGLAAAGASANETAAKAVRTAATRRFLFMVGIPVQSVLVLAPSSVSGPGIRRTCKHNASHSVSVYLRRKLIQAMPGELGGDPVRERAPNAFWAAARP